MLDALGSPRKNVRYAVAGAAVLGGVLFLVWTQPMVWHAMRLERGGRALQEAYAFAEAHPEELNPALDRALVLLQRAVQDTPPDAAAYRRLGQAWLLLGDNERAVTAFSQAIELRPNHPLLYVELGYAYDGLGQVERALEAYEQGRYGPAVEAAIVNYIKIADWRVAAGGGDQALVVLEQALELDPKNLPALYRSMIIYDGISEQASAEFAAPLRTKLRKLGRKPQTPATEPRLVALTGETIERLVADGIWSADQAQQ